MRRKRTDSLLIDALVEDIKAKKGNRRAELELAFKIKGKLDTKTINQEAIRPIPILSFDRAFLKEEDKESLLGLLH